MAPKGKGPSLEGEGLAQPEGLATAVAALRAGEVVVFPTDTVYGIGVAIEHAAGPEALYRAKRRPAAKSIPWLVAALDDIGRFGRDVPGYGWRLAEEGWPGPLTLVVRASDRVPAAFRSAAGTVALRMPDHPIPLALAAAAGPLATTSANLSGQPPAVALSEVDPALRRACRCVLAADGTLGGAPSAIVDCTGPAPRRLR